MQHGLDINLRNDAFIHNKIVTACENQSAFKTVCERPSPTLAGLFSDLRSAAAVHDRINNITINKSSTLFTDRRYHQGQQRYPLNRENNMKQFQFKSNISGKSGIKPGKRCIYCLEIEVIPPIIEHETESQFDMDYNDSQIPEFVLDTALLSVASNDDISPIFVTDYCDEIDGAKVIMALADQAIAHAFQANYNIFNNSQTTDRYGPSEFQGIIIDTGAAHYSTGGYDQCAALQKHQNLPVDKSTKRLGDCTIWYRLSVVNRVYQYKDTNRRGKISHC
ncbi:hypothetical protein GcM3_007050 [Golovinomyces cichoracearum]|uniref:Uncharacterized protein n=1 Tax=Golovinomyces cichoracearum TaxID=62708 RepID=A0A420JAN3_9PEZI|nr:hypothetical protein GcM3_007050 [Golovinomyces cichoracearum]